MSSRGGTADALGSGPSKVKLVRVQISPIAPKIYIRIIVLKFYCPMLKCRKKSLITLKDFLI